MMRIGCSIIGICLLSFALGCSTPVEVPIQKEYTHYAVGGVGPAGGMIVYDLGADRVTNRFIEAAPEDLDALYAWGPLNDSLIGLIDGYPPGTGESVTRFVADRYPTDFYAAHACAEYSVNGCDDWVLPSLDVLEAMYHQFTFKGLGNFSKVEYPSAAGEEASQVETVDFSAGESGSSRKDVPLHVRPVRSF